MKSTLWSNKVSTTRLTSKKRATTPSWSSWTSRCPPLCSWPSTPTIWCRRRSRARMTRRLPRNSTPWSDFSAALMAEICSWSHTRRSSPTVCSTRPQSLTSTKSRWSRSSRSNAAPPKFRKWPACQKILLWVVTFNKTLTLASVEIRLMASSLILRCSRMEHGHRCTSHPATCPESLRHAQKSSLCGTRTRTAISNWTGSTQTVASSSSSCTRQKSISWL